MHPGLGALDAAQCLGAGLLGREAEIHFLEVVRVNLRLLFGDALARQLGALFIRQRIVAHLFLFDFTHCSPPTAAAGAPDERRCCAWRGGSAAHSCL